MELNKSVDFRQSTSQLSETDNRLHELEGLLSEEKRHNNELQSSLGILQEQMQRQVNSAGALHQNMVAEGQDKQEVSKQYF